MAKLLPERRAKLLQRLTDAEADALVHDWRFFARPEQLAPSGAWPIWLVIAGRGFGKTRTGSEWTREKIKAGVSRVGLIGPTAADARDVMVEGESGILACSWKHDRDHKGNPIGIPSYEPSKRRLTWGNGATASLFSAEEPDRLRGPQHEIIWADELAAWAAAQDAWDMAMFGLRSGDMPQALVTTTPRPLKLVRELVKDPHNVITRGTTWDNRAHLAKTFFDKIVSKYQGTRLGRQELSGEIIEDVEGALWTIDLIDRTRIDKDDLPELTRIVVALDPSGCAGPEDSRSDEVGIVVCGLGVDNHGYVLEDLSGRFGPAEWGAIAATAVERWDASCVVAETNYGGAMVREVMRAAGPNIPFREVKASRGKHVRAEPVSLLFEQGRAHLAGKFPLLEEQLLWMTTWGYAGGSRSPDRADAAVWALSTLFPTVVKESKSGSMAALDAAMSGNSTFGFPSFPGR